MGDVIPFKRNETPGESREPSQATRRALLAEAMDEYQNSLTEAEVFELREALKLDKRDALIAQMRKQCIAVNTFLHELLALYKSIPEDHNRR